MTEDGAQTHDGVVAEDGAASGSEWGEDGPPRSGVFRWLRNHSGSATPSVFLVEELFAPSRHQARMEIEAQRRVSRPAPAPTDPPNLEPPGSPGSNDRFRGRIVIRSRGPRT
jgi:hypothetical protein